MFRYCQNLDLGIAQFGFCFENSSLPFIIEVEPMAYSVDRSSLDLGICLTADDADIFVGTGSGEEWLSTGTLEKGASYGYFSYIAGVPDGHVPCIGATVAISGTVSSGAGFDASSFYWKDGNDPNRIQEPFGSTSSDGITSSGATLKIPRPKLMFGTGEVEYYNDSIPDGVPSLVQLPSDTADRWPSPTAHDTTCP